jgi:hypothetical protein
VATAAFLVIPVVAFLTWSGTAYAGAPFPQTAYDGATAHGNYTVDLTPGCADPNSGAYCTGTGGMYAPPTSLSIEVDTHPRPGTRCKADDYAFDPTTLKPNGAFSATAAFSSGSPQLTFTVTGTFLTAGTVHGTVTGNFGCGTDSFTISLKPLPLIATAPCAMLLAVHAARVVGAGQPATFSDSANSFTPQGGQCGVTIGLETAATGITNLSTMRFIVASSPSELGSGVALQYGSPFQHHVPLKALGAGGSLYYNSLYVKGKPTSSVQFFEVDFRHGAVWASLERQPSEAGCECFHPAGFASQEHQVIAVAKALEPLLH